MCCTLPPCAAGVDGRLLALFCLHGLVLVAGVQPGIAECPLLTCGRLIQRQHSPRGRGGWWPTPSRHCPPHPLSLSCGHGRWGTSSAVSLPSLSQTRLLVDGGQHRPSTCHPVGAGHLRVHLRSCRVRVVPTSSTTSGTRTPGLLCPRSHLLCGYPCTAASDLSGPSFVPRLGHRGCRGVFSFPLRSCLMKFHP